MRGKVSLPVEVNGGVSVPMMQCASAIFVVKQLKKVKTTSQGQIIRVIFHCSNEINVIDCGAADAVVANEVGTTNMAGRTALWDKSENPPHNR